MTAAEKRAADRESIVIAYLARLADAEYRPGVFIDTGNVVLYHPAPDDRFPALARQLQRPTRRALVALRRELARRDTLAPEDLLEGVPYYLTLPGGCRAPFYLWIAPLEEKARLYAERLTRGSDPLTWREAADLIAVLLALRERAEHPARRGAS